MEVTAYEIDIMVVSMSYSLINETIIQSRMHSCRSLQSLSIYSGLR